MECTKIVTKYIHNPVYIELRFPGAAGLCEVSSVVKPDLLHGCRIQVVSVTIYETEPKHAMFCSRMILIFCILFVLPLTCLGAELNWVAHWLGEEKREQLVMEVAKEFRFLYPDTELNIEFAQTLDNEGKTYKWRSAYRIVEMITSGKITADVVFLDTIVYDYVAELLGDPLWGKKHLEDVSDLDWFRASQKDFILHSPYYREQTGGILVGPYIEGFFTCLWLNQETARRVGLEVKNRKMTLDDFFSYALRLSEYNELNDTAIPLIKLSSWNRLDVLFEYLFKSLIGDPEFASEEQYHPEKERFFLETLLMFEKLASYGIAVNNDFSELNIKEWARDFLGGDGLFVVAGSYVYNLFLATSPEKLSNVLPVEPPVVNYFNGLVGDYIPVFAVMKKSPNKEAALNLLRLWSEPKIADKWVSYTKNPTGIKGHLENPASENDGDVYSKYILDMTRNYSHLPMRYFQGLSYVFGDKSPVTPPELRASLVRILSGDLSAQNYYDDVMQLFRDS